MILWLFHLNIDCCIAFMRISVNLYSTNSNSDWGRNMAVDRTEKFTLQEAVSLKYHKITRIFKPKIQPHYNEKLANNTIDHKPKFPC
jgi:hypothetical protein